MLFDDVVSEPVDTSAGSIDLPIQYTDASMFAAIWRVNPTRVKLPAPLEPWVLFGRALVMLCAFEYRKTSIGPYGELGLGVLAKPHGTSPSWLKAGFDLRKETNAGLYVFDLPVTTPGARAAGIELWGYPKYVTPMQTEFSERRSRMVLGTEIDVTLDHGGRGAPMPAIPLCTWSVSRENHLIRTDIDTAFTARWGGDVTVKVLGDGPVTETMRSLGIDQAKPLLAFRADPMQSLLPRGVDRGPCGPRDSKNDLV